ncbi:MAG: class I SAM-dependent methyltransferase, partial [Patescibacteria group bacterium]
MTNSENHFNDIASDYDYWKNHNRYYYQNLFILYGSLIPSGSSVVEIGCGTGDIISSLDPRQGLGIDISERMINVARKKHADKSSIHFVREDISISKTPFDAEYIILADVLEHVDDLPKFLDDLSVHIKPEAKVIISVANPIWEPVLMLAERMKMKMPEGPHKRYSVKITEDM